MRNSTASILWILIFSFGILWVLADVDFFGGITAGPSNMGSVNGDGISFEEYNQRVSFYTDEYNQTQDGIMTAETRAALEEQAWDDLVAARLMQQKMNEMGISVTDRELLNMVTGDNPAPFIRQQFQQQDGTIDRVALQAAIDAPENSEIWIMIEQQLRDDRRQQKMNNYIGSGMRVSNLDIRNQYIRNNSFADIEFIRFPYADVADDEISVSEDEMRSYLRNNPDQFRRSETYRFRYVSWDITPTSADTANAIRDVEEMRPRFAEAENDSLFFERNFSATPFRGAFVDPESIRDEYRPVLDLEVGEVSEVLMIDDAPHILKKIDERNGEIKFAAFSYPVEADPVATIDRRAESARDFEFYAEDEGFMEEAERREYEVRTATATKGNNFIPGLGQSQQTLMELESMRVNSISDPIELDDQFIVIQLQERIPEGTRPFEEVRSQLENIVRNNKRKSAMLERVRDLHGSASELEDLAEAAGKEIQIAEDLRMSANSIPGAGREPGVIGRAFGMEPGQVSAPIEGENAVFVLRVNDITMANPDEMTNANRTQIRNQLEQQKFAAFSQIFIDKLKEEATIRDNRNRVMSR
ncbi:SurA N-terminal domain-containing protein [Rhodohalobacter sp. SW132]|nr:SurA N-terminal domain-containing protein [Rhodohalobacter sp. SW132]